MPKGIDDDGELTCRTPHGNEAIEGIGADARGRHRGCGGRLWLGLLMLDSLAL